MPCTWDVEQPNNKLVNTVPHMTAYDSVKTPGPPQYQIQQVLD